MAWKQVAMVFNGNSVEAGKLYGKKVRTGLALSLNQYDPVAQNVLDQRENLKHKDEGFVGRIPQGKFDEIVLVFPAQQPCPASLDQLIRRPFKSVLVNFATFRRQFEIDS